MPKTLLFKIARSSIAKFFIGFAFAHLTPLLPFKKHIDTRDVVVFKHPVPSWKIHFLAVPKKSIHTLLDINLDSQDGKTILIHILEALQQLAISKNLSAYKIIVNGGKYQDVPQLHFHLCNGITLAGAVDPKLDSGEAIKGELVANSQNTALYLHTRPNYKKHYVISTTQENIPEKNGVQPNFSEEMLSDMFKLAQETVNSSQLSAYSVMIDVSPGFPYPGYFVHLVSNAKA